MLNQTQYIFFLSKNHLLSLHAVPISSQLNYRADFVLCLRVQGDFIQTALCIWEVLGQAAVDLLSLQKWNMVPLKVDAFPPSYLLQQMLCLIIADRETVLLIAYPSGLHFHGSQSSCGSSARLAKLSRAVPSSHGQYFSDKRTLGNVLLLVFAPVKQIGDLQALSFSDSSLEFGPGLLSLSLKVKCPRFGSLLSG